MKRDLYFLFLGFSSSSYQLQILTEEQVDFYNKHSYLVLPDLLTSAEKKAIPKYLHEIQNWDESQDQWLTYYEIINGKRILSRIENFYLFHKEMRKLVEGKLGQAAADCLGEPACTFKDKINFKFPGGFGYDAHQDGPAWEMFQQGFHISALIPADAMTIDNGCIWVSPGKWQEGDALKMNDVGDIDVKVAASLCWMPIVCDIGTVIMFNSLMPHKSDTNHSMKSRSSFYITWNGISKGDRHADYYNLRQKMYPSDSQRDPNKDYSEGIKLFSEQSIEKAK